MGWEGAARDLDERRALARSMGDPARREARRDAGRLDARGRVTALLDEGSFHEIGTLAGTGEGAPADALVAGHGTIGGRPVLVGAEDATVKGGSIGIAGAAKRERLARLALQERVPIVMLLDGGGHRVTNTLQRRVPAPTDLAALADCRGVVPVLVGVLGASAGHGALAAALADVVVMVEGTSQLFTAGPPIVQAATGEQVDVEQLGGSEVHAATGMAHLVSADEPSALRALRDVFGYLPRHRDARPSADPAVTPPSTALTDIVPTDLRAAYDGRRALACVVDAGSALELQAGWGGALITALARLDGEPIAVVASQPTVRAGSIDAAAAEKAARFIRWTGDLGLPLLLLADTPGVLPGTASEREGVLRAAADLYVAQHRHPGPKLHVTLRKAIGFGSSVMGQNPFDGQTVTLALPIATVGAMPATGASRATHADDETASTLAGHESAGPYRLADTLSYDEVVAPEELRARLVAALRLALLGRRDAL